MLALIAALSPTPLLGPAQSATCMAPGPPRVELARHALVFLGTVESWRDTSFMTPRNGPYRCRLSTVRMQSLWKGNPRRLITISGEAQSGSFYPEKAFEAGETYLIYADSSGTGWRVSPCSRTAPAARAAEDLAALGKPVIVQRLPGRKPRPTP